jgi:hypothetical protein
MERWLSVVGYEGWYEVSDRGRVRSLDRVVTDRGSLRQRRFRGRVLKLAPYEREDGPSYFQVSLSRDGQVDHPMVHCLVLAAFVGPCPVGQESLHGPGGGQDNRWPENLAYGTHWQNIMEKWRDGTMQATLTGLARGQLR